MTRKPPFLSLEQRVEYLYRKEYFVQGSFSDSDITRLGEMNFHYFLGYARNFRELCFEGKLIGPKMPHRVFRLIDLDAQVSELLYSGIRNAELLLRHYFVQEYCEKFDPWGSFLESENYLDLGGEYTNDHLAWDLMNDILACEENYVKDLLFEAGKRLKCAPPKRCDTHNWDQCLKLTADLPIWAVVDSVPLGRLVRLIQRCDNSEDDQNRVWRKVAADMEIQAGRFDTGMASLRSLRNLVSHHSRLWLRPTTYTASKKGQFRKETAKCHAKSMLPAFYNVASFQGRKDRRLAFAERLEWLINAEADYKFGVSSFGSSIKG